LLSQAADPAVTSTVYTAASGHILRGFIVDRSKTTMYVTTDQHHIVKVTLASGTSSVVAGLSGTSGLLDGLGTAALFNNPR
jgi:hypothetical protein